VLFTIPRVVIAGLKGGSGKTTLSLGLLAHFHQTGHHFVPFKKGPDYIDAGWLGRAAGVDCHNLDAFLFPEETVLSSFIAGASGSEGAVIEGNRGIFDGMDEHGTFSTARLAGILTSPVIIVLDATKMTTTAAALIKGVLSFDETLRLGGVVLNRVAGTRHETVARKAIEEHTGVPVIGAIGKLKEEIIGERHLGLLPFHESTRVDEVLASAAALVRESVDCDRILEVMRSAHDLSSPERAAAHDSEKAVRIGVLKDEAFQFYYPENLQLLVQGGAEVVEINGMKEGTLPEIDALYIGGGFPETQALRLSRNRTLLDDIRGRAEEGLPVYAECGGLMFLGRSIDIDHESVEMVGLLPLDFKMRPKPVAHGYTIVTVEGENAFFPLGTELKGHEFHYSSAEEGDEQIRMVFRMKRGKGIRNGFDGIVYKNVLATYTHLHALGSPQWVEGVIGAAQRYRKKRTR